ncbi:NAD(P)H-quinone oxidoreductase [Gordonia sp. DT219]|uniref:NAD(P)H-quinone oxidoreductase n=1 Tax=Gordonia sp. DT219 TaxID=3416658 RepID=UPI003CF19EA0
MRAVTVSSSGDLSVSTIDDPVAGADEVIVDVVSAGVNRADLLQRRGHYPPPPGAPDTLGLEVSGHISEVGPDVSGWSVGDEVCALLAGGGYAERVVVPAAQVLPVPAGVPVADAAALPEVACTVVSNVVEAGGLRAGELLLIHGGSSGIGTHATQLAHALDARVAVTARTQEKLDRCAGFGADILINYATEDFAQVISEHGGADVILDIIGAKYLSRNVSSLNTGGRLVIIGMQGGATAELSIATLMGKRASVIGTTLRSRPVDGDGGKRQIVAHTQAVTWPLIAAGKVVPVIDSVYDLDDAAAAHERLDSGEAIGKVLLRVSAARPATG